MSIDPSAVRRPRLRMTRRRWIVAAILAAVLLGGAGTAWALLRPRVVAVAPGDTMVLTPGTLVDGISATGTVVAATSARIYSTLTQPVTLVRVEVGQKVVPGDVLAQLDPTSLDQQIAVKRASMTQSQTTAAASLAASRHKYEAATDALRQGTNSAIVNAEGARTNAYDNWMKATKASEDFENALDDGENAQVISARTALDNASANEASAHSSERRARDAWETAGRPDDPDATRVALSQAEQALDAARTARRNAQDAYDAAVTSAQNMLSDLRAATDQAQNAYVTAQNGVAAAEASARTELQATRDAVTSSQASSSTDAAVTELAGLLADRESALITSPIEGTVTAVNATVGAPASGVLFVVETPDRLAVDSSVNEYDVNTLKTGMEVRISSDATRDAVYEGVLRSVAPASEKGADGESVAGSDIRYATGIDVTSTGTGLRIGMNVRVQYVVAEATNALSVPSDAVVTDGQGNTTVLVLVDQPGGDHTVEAVPVTLGLETDIDVAVSGRGVREGMRVLTSPAGFSPGMVVSLGGV